jgi:hypothetical protein
VADEDLQRRSTFTYYIGETKKFWEEVRNPRTRAPLTADSVAGRLWNRDDNTSVAVAETIRISSGLVEATLANTYMTAPGKFEIEWDITYTDGSDTPVMTIYTTIIAKDLDSTYLIGLVPQLRMWADDDPEDASKRNKSDIKYKPYLENAVRLYVTDYTLAKDVDGNWDVTVEPTAGGDDENLIILWAAWLYYKFGYTAIASERTRMFSISYSEAYLQVRDRVDAIEEEIIKIDETQAMYFASETSIEFWGKINTRTTDAIATWDDVS